MTFCLRSLQQRKREIAESSSGVGWDTTVGTRTAHNFRQTLTPPAGVSSFSGRQVFEADGGGVEDHCHFVGAGVPDEVTDITSGGDWTVASDNTWGVDDFDLVGWYESAVNFYQTAAIGKPCWAAGWQQMTIICPSGNPFATEYTKNFLRYEIGETYVTSERQSSIQQRDWP